jgi:hypothetical protein
MGSMTRQEQVQYIIENYPDNYTDEISQYLGLTKSTVYNIANQYGLKKSEIWKEKDRVFRKKILTKYGKDYRFEKGHTPKNKGAKLAPEVVKKMEKSFFKKGSKPHNIKYDGHERVSKEGYVLVRVSIGRYMPKHQHIWRQLHGDIPKGHVVIFKDKDKRNFDINNLVLISRSELMKRNTIHNYPSEIKQCIKIISKIKKRINEKQN